MINLTRIKYYINPNHDMDDNPNRRVVLEEHNPSWKNQFTEEKNRIQELLKDFYLEIEHVGSTSVSDLISKPIIDIAIAIKDFKASDEIISLLESNIAYHYDPTKNEKLPGRRHLWKRSQDVHQFHIWLVERDSNDWKDMIYVRNYLRNNISARKRYGDFKRELLEQNINTISDYRKNKSKIYKQILNEAWVDAQKK